MKILQISVPTVRLIDVMSAVTIDVTNGQNSTSTIEAFKNELIIKEMGFGFEVLVLVNHLEL